MAQDKRRSAVSRNLATMSGLYSLVPNDWRPAALKTAHMPRLVSNFSAATALLHSFHFSRPDARHRSS